MNIWWIRRDLRLEDNTALHLALSIGEPIIPLFIIDPHRVQHPAAKRHAFLYSTLRALDSDLRRRGSRLITREGDPETVLQQMTADTGAQAIIAEEAYSPFARRRDDAIAARLPLRLTPGLTVHHPKVLTRPDGRPYTLFGAFKRAWLHQPFPAESDLLSAPDQLPAVPADLASAELPDGNQAPGFPAGPAEAQRRLRAFTEDEHAPINAYVADRDHFDRDATARISPYLRFGSISPRRAVIAAISAARTANPDSEGAVSWLNELIWREYCQAILYHFPNVLGGAYRAALGDMPWQNGVEDYAAWCDGRTGFPVVDAAMRQLVQTGWLHNRLRMIAASFLVKDLLIDWRWGERFFMEHLIDGDAAANNGGWQWTAGTGADAAPYFHVLSPVAQGKKYDPAGTYVRTWLPELTGVPDEFVHTPWTMPAATQGRSACIIDQHYPAPIVDHALARRRALSVYHLTSTGHSSPK